MGRFYRIVFEQIDFRFGRTTQSRGVLEQHKLFAGQRPFSHHQPGGLGPTFHQSDEQSDKQPDARETEPATDGRFTIRGSQHQIDRIEHQAAHESAE